MVLTVLDNGLCAAGADTRQPQEFALRRAVDIHGQRAKPLRRLAARPFARPERPQIRRGGRWRHGVGRLGRFEIIGNVAGGFDLPGDRRRRAKPGRRDGLHHRRQVEINGGRRIILDPALG